MRARAGHTGRILGRFWRCPDCRKYKFVRWCRLFMVHNLLREHVARSVSPVCACSLSILWLSKSISLHISLDLRGSWNFRPCVHPGNPSPSWSTITQCVLIHIVSSFYLALSEWCWCISGIFLFSLGFSNMPGRNSDQDWDTYMLLLQLFLTIIRYGFLPQEELMIPFLYPFCFYYRVLPCTYRLYSLEFWDRC